MQPALSLTLVQASHGAAPVLGAVSLQVYPGETVALTGPSGVGKTTLLRVIAGLHRRWDGALHLPGRLAMVFQEPVLMPWRSALDNICLTAGCTADEGRAALASVDLADKAMAYPAALSLGQQRRLSLARAFAAKPDVLLMDEAFVSLDAALADEMMSLFEKLRENRNLATVIVTHDPAEARRLASRVLILDGKPAQIVDRLAA
ncbi:MAG: ABC transporter ATP-binding protein [Paracoccaceae bacterium]